MKREFLILSDCFGKHDNFYFRLERKGAIRGAWKLALMTWYYTLQVVHKMCVLIITSLHLHSLLRLLFRTTSVTSEAHRVLLSGEKLTPVHIVLLSGEKSTQAHFTPGWRDINTDTCIIAGWKEIVIGPHITSEWREIHSGTHIIPEERGEGEGEEIDMGTHVTAGMRKEWLWHGAIISSEWRYLTPPHTNTHARTHARARTHTHIHTHIHIHTSFFSWVGRNQMSEAPFCFLVYSSLPCLIPSTESRYLRFD